MPQKAPFFLRKAVRAISDWTQRAIVLAVWSRGSLFNRLCAKHPKCARGRFFGPLAVAVAVNVEDNDGVQNRIIFPHFFCV